MSVQWLDESAARATQSLKWSKCGPETLAAWVAEMDVALAPPIASALHDAIELHMVGYPRHETESDLREVIADWHARRLGHEIHAERVLYSAEVISGLAFALSTVLEPGSGVVVPSPAYPPFSEAIAWAGMREIRVPLANGMTDPEAIDRVLADSAGAVIVCNPHNPTGRVPTLDELAAIGDVAERRGAWVFADEVHAALTHPGRSSVPFSMAAPALADRAITLSSASKAFNLPGLRFAWMISHDDAVHARLAAQPVHDRGPDGTLGQVAARAALADGDDWLDDLRQDFVGRFEMVRSALAPRIGESVLSRPGASYLSWIDFSGTAIGDDPAAHIARAGVRVAPGTDYGAEGLGHIRLNVAAHTDTLERALDRILTVL